MSLCENIGDCSLGLQCPLHQWAAQTDGDAAQQLRARIDGAVHRVPESHDAPTLRELLPRPAGERGQGYPAERKESQMANAGILAQVKQGASKDFIAGLKSIDPALVKQAVVLRLLQQKLETLQVEVLKQQKR